MKVSRLSSLSLLLALAACPASAQSVTDAPKAAPGSGEKIELKDDKGDTPKVELAPLEKAQELPNVMPAKQDGGAESFQNVAGLEKLSAEKQAAVVRDLSEVATYLRGVRWLEGLEKLTEVEMTTGDFHLVENMRGAIYTRMKDYKQARVHFEKAVALSKGLKGQSFHPRFNIAELDFVEHKWDAARASFTGLLNDPTREADKSTENLINFKLLICDVQQQKVDAANKLLEKYDANDTESPAYYFSRAAIEFGAGKKEEAGTWLESAGKIYPKDMNEVFNDSMVEMGWLETLEN